jgi:predicted secreted protein
MGAGGVEIWTFKLKPTALTVPHQTTLRMIYARPWNKTDSGTQIVFHVTTVLNLNHR